MYCAQMVRLREVVFLLLNLEALAKAQDYQDPDPLEPSLNQDTNSAQDRNETAITKALPTKDYWLQTEVQVPRWEDTSRRQFRSKLQSSLNQAILVAFRRQQAQHYGQQQGQQDLTEDTTTGEEYLSVQILNVTRIQRSQRVIVLYTVQYQGWYVKADVVLKDLKLVPNSELSVYVGYPVIKNSAYTSPEEQERAKYWIVWVVVGGVLAILMCGWLTLCAYYNTCGRAMEESVGAIDRKRQERIMERGITEKQQIHNIYPDIQPTMIKTEKIVVKEDTVQTDITAKMLENRLDDLHLLGDYNTSEPYYATISKTPSSEKVFPEKPKFEEESGYLKPDVKKKRKTDENVKWQDQVTELIEDVDSKTTDTQIDANSNPKVPIEEKHEDDKKRQEISQLLDSNANWTPHQAADQVERIFHIKESLSIPPANHPRPMTFNVDSSNPGGGVLEFHSRELQPATQMLSNNDAILRQFYMESVQHIVPGNVL